MSFSFTDQIVASYLGFRWRTDRKLLPPNVFLLRPAKCGHRLLTAVSGFKGVGSTGMPDVFRKLGGARDICVFCPTAL
jgi:hypothetical protein